MSGGNAQAVYIFLLIHSRSPSLGIEQYLQVTDFINNIDIQIEHVEHIYVLI